MVARAEKQATPRRKDREIDRQRRNVMVWCEKLSSSGKKGRSLKNKNIDIENGWKYSETCRER